MLLRRDINEGRGSTQVLQDTHLKLCTYTGISVSHRDQCITPLTKFRNKGRLSNDKRSIYSTPQIIFQVGEKKYKIRTEKGTREHLKQWGITVN